MKKKLQKFKWAVFCSLVILSSCNKMDSVSTAPSTDTATNAEISLLVGMNAPSSFNYETDKDVALNITILAPDNTPIKNIPICILTKAEEMGGVVLFKALTDENGKISGTVKLPTSMNQVVIDPKYLGIIRNAAVNISGGTILCTLGGSNGYSGNVSLSSPLNERMANNTGNNLRPMTAYSFMGTYDNQGKPNYLETPNQTISAEFLAKINASVPESRPITIHHPAYLKNNTETNANIIAQSDVYFTFVTEGAGYRNSIAYFTYPTNNPPQTVDAVDSLHIILPNASLAGSGGILHAGNTVKLGRFNAGTSIGFALIANGWSGTAVGNGLWIVYSLDQLNPASSASLKRQSVFLYDNVQDLFLVGIEDIRRDNPNCDNDFNDCIFYIKSNIVNSISTKNVNPVDIPVDTDHDGVNDVYDDFPTDPTRAYLNYYPSATTMGTIAFEDNWPYLGDYDMNDLVVGYRYAVISNAQNKVVEMKAKYVLKASGATYKNGFGVEFPFASSLVSGVTGSIVTNNQVVSLGSNGCETGQSKAVIIPFDDAFTAMNTPRGFINTVNSSPFLSRDTISMNISFTRLLLQSELGTPPFNPFIIINRTRGREAHLAGYTPTQKVDTKYYKMGVNNTIPAQNKYYKTSSNLPWGLAFSGNFSYMAETRAINKSYTKFIPWAQSNGTANINWYKDTLNIVKSFIYKH